MTLVPGGKPFVFPCCGLSVEVPSIALGDRDALMTLRADQFVPPDWERSELGGERSE